MDHRPKPNMDIPGYYWDNNTRRYYKEDPAHPRPKPKVSPAMVESNDVLKTIRTPRNTLDLLNKRELGFGKSSSMHSFEDFITFRSLQHLKCIKQLRPIGQFANSSTKEVTFLKGGENCTYLESSIRSVYTLKQNMHFFSPIEKYPTFKSFQPSYLSTVDLCEGFKSTRTHSLFVVTSDSNTWRMSLWQHTWNPQFTAVEFLNPYTTDTPVWCCNKNDFTEQFILGKRNKIVICAFRPNSPFVQKEIRGEVRSVQFDKQGNLIYAGLHTGHFEILDLRTDGSVFRTRMHTKGIDEIVPVFDEKQLICGAFDGMLCNFDLRMRKSVNEYLEHVHSPRKVPFSICESNNLLCATGSDNITRIWSLGKGGGPIVHIHPPTAGGSTCRSWLVSDGYKCLLYQYQNSDAYVYGNGSFEFLPDSTF